MEYVNLISVSKEDLLKGFTNWKKDLKRMTKIYRSIEDSKPTGLGTTEYERGINKKHNSEQLVKFKEAKKLFITFTNNFENWVYKTLLPNIDREEQGWLHKSVRKLAWTALNDIHPDTLFPESYNPNIEKHVDSPESVSRKKKDNYVNKYNKSFKLALDAIEEYINTDEESNEFLYDQDEQFQVGGIDVIVKRDNRTKGMDKYLKIFISELKKAIIKVKKAKLGKALKGLLVNVVFDSSMPQAGSFDFPNITINLGSVGAYEEVVFLHELGHRFYYELLSGAARKYWDTNIVNPMTTIEDRDVDTFMSKFVTDLDKLQEMKFSKRKKYLRSLVKKANLSKIDKAKFSEIASRLPTIGYDDTIEDLKSKLKSRVVGERVHLEYISEYARKNSSEAFSEVFALYLANSKGKLGEWTQDLFKRTMKLGDSKFKANVEYVRIKEN